MDEVARAMVPTNGSTSSPPSSHSSPINVSSSPSGASSSCSYSTRNFSGSSDESGSSRSHDKMTPYETNLARQLLALKEGVPSDIITPRRQRQFIDDTSKDAAYWERRRKNNEAAKRSREKRRMNDMAMESQINKVQQEMDNLRRELIAIKNHYGLDPTQTFTTEMIPRDVASPASVISHTSGPGPPQSPLTLPPPGSHVMNPGRVMMPRLLRPMVQMPFHSNNLVLLQHPANTNIKPDPSVPCTPNAENLYCGHPVRPMDTSYELTYRQDDQVIERTAEYRSAEDSYHQSDEYSGHSSRSGAVSRADDQECPLNLVVKQEASKPVKETSAELSIRMHEEAARRYEEIKAGSVDRADTTRDGSVISPGSSSTSSGSPYSKRMRLDESDSVMEAESTTSNTSSQSPNLCVVDSKYTETRKRNNESCRRSRENRKHIAKTREETTNELEMKNNKLRKELDSLASQVSNLRELIVSKHVVTCDDKASVAQKCEATTMTTDISASSE